MANFNHTTTTTKRSPLWNDRIHSFIDLISKADAKIGDLPSALLNAFLPKDSVSTTFSHIITHSEYNGLIERGVVGKVLETGRLDEIYRTLGNYCDGNDNRKCFLDYLVEQCDLFYKENTKESDTGLQFVVVMIFFSFLHLTVLRERNCYQEEIFGCKNSICVEDLKSYLKTYKTYFATIRTKWEHWCEEKIKNEKEEHVTRSFEEIKAEFMKLYVYTSAVEQFAPMGHDSPIIVQNLNGPCIIGLRGDEKLCDDKPGVIVGIAINCGTVIDGIRVYYKEPTCIREGTQMGNNEKGNLYSIKGLDEEYNHIIAVEIYYNLYMVCGLRFFFSDGSSTEILGEGVGKRRRCGSTEKNGNLKLTGLRTASTFHEDVRVISRIELRFDPIKPVEDDKAILKKGVKSRHLF